MGPEISAAPLGSPTNGESSSLPAQSPQSTVLGSGGNSPWLDPASPNLGTSPIFDRKRASLMGLLDSNRAENTSTGLGLYDSSREKPCAPPKEDTLFQKVMKSKWSMVLFLLLGIGGALSHHFLYWHLKGRDVKDQEWWLRLGQFISFVSKAGFVLSVLMAQQQTAWRAVGKKDYSVHAIDSLFGSSHDIMELFSREAWTKTWLVMILSLYIWISPLVVIFSSATLSVSPGLTVDRDARCPSVRTLNFSQESTNKWDEPRRAESDGLIGISLSFWERTGARYEDDDNVDYYSSPSAQFSAIADKVFTANQALQGDHVAEDICGIGWNCSTVIHFVGPGYKCDSVTPKSGVFIDDFAGVEAPFNMTELAPEGSHTYFALTQKGDYGAQIELNKTGKPVQQLPYPANLGAFKAEPIIWLGYTTVDDITKRQPERKGAPGWDEAFTPAVLACEHYVTNYTVNLTYTGGLQNYNVTQRDYMYKVINTTYDETLKVPTDGLLNGVVAVPKENYVLPIKENMETYRRIAAYHSLGKVLRDMVNGTIELPNHISKSKVMVSRLMDKRDYIAVTDLQQEVRRLYEDLLISLLSNPQMLVVSWAANTSELSGTLPGGPLYPCYRHKLVNKFAYQWEVLLAVYAISFVIASVGVISGMYAMWKDGVHEQREMTFSAIAGATKKLSLDQYRDKETMVRSNHVGQGSGGRVYEFELRDGGEQDNNSSRSALESKSRFATRETTV
ncbi:hypothetical protein B0J15DRAFT_141753 [Fusarium solani]|uniref:Uncharacterized protein n=1 Tax=Fusarium solani TaxID=169388 RepID=A0A9P9GJ05_FUSSL|nr:uncharacterized protein B0J15DRAFT_141753 [Fusarium solani]KAH7239796.1 hypothetical protein B0J15DRAFT_141753 [Fusarium solani]